MTAPEDASAPPRSTTPAGPAASTPAASRPAPPPQASPAAPAAPAAPAGPRRPKRRFGSVTDMVRSLAAVLGAALVVVWLTPRQQGEEVRVIDYAGPLTQARLSAPYDLYAPEGLPGGWRATSARSDRAASSGGVTWHLGFVTPTDRYAAVAQRPADPAATNAAAGAGRDEGTVSLAGAQWQRRLRDDGERSLWRQDGQSVVAVTGSAPEDELAQLAVALRPG